MSGKDAGGIENVAPEILGEQTLSITTEQLLDYYVKHRCDGPCEACGAEGWHHPKEKEMPSIMAMQMPRSPSSSGWFFWMVCTSCSNTRLIAAGDVWEHYFGDKSGE